MTGVPIPFNLSRNDRDRRGFPIPFIVYRDKTGVAHFTVDDVVKLNIALAEKRCGLCGKPLKLGQLWLISGPESAFSDEGLFTVPPAHAECARYSVQICPYLAAPRYSRLIEDRTLNPDAVDDMASVHNDHIAPPRPSLIVVARTSGIRLIDPDDGSGKMHIAPRRPWKEIEFWRHGKQVSRQQAEAIAAQDGTPPGRLKWWPQAGG